MSRNNMRPSLILLLITCLVSITDIAHAARCLFVSSYHQGYPWADGIEEGVRRTLDGQCELQQINMDTKRQQDVNLIQTKAHEIKQFIDDWQPDVVIAADDNASKFLVMPYLKDSHIPVVFCGINWTVDEYGYPYSNTTGMIEVAPIRELFTKIREILPTARNGVYLAADTLTEQKSYQRFARYAKEHNLHLDKRLASRQAGWTHHYIEAQQADFIILGTESGIADWDEARALATIKKHGHKLSVTVYEWMVKYAAIGMHKLPQEHGEWAARSALAILRGIPPNQIPIIPNQDWDMLINPQLLRSLPLQVPDYIWIQGKTLNED